MMSDPGMQPPSAWAERSGSADYPNIHVALATDVPAVGETPVHAGGSDDYVCKPSQVEVKRVVDGVEKVFQVPAALGPLVARAFENEQRFSYANFTGQGSPLNMA